MTHGNADRQTDRHEGLNSDLDVTCVVVLPLREDAKYSASLDLKQIDFRVPQDFYKGEDRCDDAPQIKASLSSSDNSCGIS